MKPLIIDQRVYLEQVQTVETLLIINVNNKTMEEYYFSNF